MERKSLTPWIHTHAAGSGSYGDAKSSPLLRSSLYSRLGLCRQMSSPTQESLYRSILASFLVKREKVSEVANRDKREYRNMRQGPDKYAPRLLGRKL